MSSVNESGLKSGLLPNVYIKKIRISEGPALTTNAVNGFDRTANVVAIRNMDESTSYEAIGAERPFAAGALWGTLELVVKEAQTKKNKGWMKDPIKRQTMAIRVIQSMNANLTQELATGTYLNRSPFTMPENFNKFLDYQIQDISLELNDLTRLDQKTSTSQNGTTGKRITSLYKEVVFGIPRDKPSHLTYFVLCEYQSPNDEGLQNSVHSMVVREDVIRDSMFMVNSFYLLDPQQDVWPGPYHKHGAQGYMEGAFHVPTPHSKLSRKMISNLKLEDLTIFKEVEDLQVDIATPYEGRSSGRLFSSYLTRDAEENALLMINFDHLEFMVKHSKFGRLYRLTSPKLQNYLLRLSAITDLTVTRERVNVRRGLNSLESPADLNYDFDEEDVVANIIHSADGATSLQTQYRYTVDGPHSNIYVDSTSADDAPVGYKLTAAIREVGVDKMASRRTFSVSDQGITATLGAQYEYGMNIQVKDGAFLYLRSKLQELREAYQLVQEYKALAERPGHYDFRLNRFSEVFVRHQQSQASDGFAPWMGAVVKYIEVLDLLTDITMTQKDRLSRSLYSILSPVGGTLDSITLFADMLIGLEDKVATLVGGSVLRHERDKSAIAQGSPLRVRIERQVKFAGSFNTSTISSTGFDYFGLGLPQNDMSLLITADQFRARIQEELNRYQTNLYTSEEISQNFEFLTQTQTNALFSTTTQYSYIAPAFVHLAGEGANLLAQNRDPLDFDTVSAIVQQMVYSPSSFGGSAATAQPNSNVLGLLTLTGKGATEQRLQALNQLYMHNAANQGIEVRDPFEPFSDALSACQLQPASAYMGAGGLFSDAAPKLNPNTVEVPQSNPPATSVLMNALSIDNVANSPQMSMQATPPSNISFDLSQDNNFLAQGAATIQSNGLEQTNALITTMVDEYPPQFKLAALNKEKIYSSVSADISTNQDTKTSAFIFNFGMIRVVEYLSYESGEAEWVRVDEAALNSIETSLLCRIRRVTLPQLNVGAFEALNSVPVYNEYFLLSAQQSAPPIVREVVSGAGITPAALLKGPERRTATLLMSSAKQSRHINNNIEFLSTTAPGTPTGFRGKVSGISSKSGAPTAADAPLQPLVQSGAVTGGGTY